MLHNLPFNALYDGNHLFIEKYKVRYLPNSSVLRFLKEKALGSQKSQGALVIGNPTGDLKYSEREAIEIAKIFNVKPLLRDDAKKQVVIKEVSGKKVLHFSCHGKFEQLYQRYSRLLLSDGNLYVLDVYNLDINADIVVLSACETALGELTDKAKLSMGDEVEGFIRAFIYAGSPTVIATPWRVDDEITSKLFLKFYKSIGDKIDKIRQAQIYVMKRKIYSHPFYWAGFILIGEK